MSDTAIISALNSGELSPRLDGRVDKEFYSAGGRTVENMLPVVQGPIVQRSGTKYMGTVRDSSKRTALIPFEFNTSQAYDLEFGDQYIRVYKNDALVLSTSTAITGITQANPGVVTANAHGLVNGDRVFISGVAGMVEVNNREFTVAGAAANTFQLSGVNTTTFGARTSGGTVGKIYEITTPYLQADLFDADNLFQVQFAQTADVMYLVHQKYAPRKLSRQADASWTLATAVLKNGPFAAANGDDSIRVFCTVTGSNYQPGDTVTVTANSAIFSSGMAGMIVYLEEIYFDQLAVYPWELGRTNTVNTSQWSHDGNVYLSIATVVASGSVAPTHTEGDAWDGNNGSSNQQTKWRYLHSHWAIVKLDTFTDSKNMSGTVITYLCNGLAPASKTITNVTNSGGICSVTSAAHGYNEGDYVHITGVTGATQANGDWKAINVATNTFELSGSSAPSAYVSGGTAKRFSTWKFRLGAFSDAKGYPSAVSFFEERLAFAATTSQPDTVWLSCSGDYDRFQIKAANEITPDQAIDITLAQGQVNKIVWMTPTTEGLILGTSSSEFLLGPAQTTTALAPDNVKALRVSDYGSRAVQPHRGGPGVTIFTQRAGRKVRNLGGTQANDQVGTDLTVRADHLTRQYPVIDMAWTQEPNPIVWAVRSDGQLLSFTFEREQSVFAWGRHILGGNSDAGDTVPAIVEAVSSIPSQDGLSNKLTLIVQRYINGATVRTIETLRPLFVDGDALSSAWMMDAGLQYSGSAATVISGLNHLIGETVAILADGRVHPSKVVAANGSVTLDYAASTVTIGLAVRARFETMRLETVTRSGTAQGKQKRIVRAAVRVAHTNQFRYGRTFADARQLDMGAQADALDAPPALVSKDQMIDWPDDWQREKRMCFENLLPTPFQLVAIFPAVEVADQ